MGNGFNLPSLDILFGGAGADGVAVQDIPLSKIDPFPGHPFRVRDDDEMQRLVESIRDGGVHTPILVRERADRYQLISGHRRKRAAELAWLDTIPAIVREMDDDTATIAMVDANTQREKVLPSERAWSYRMKLEAMKHQGKASRQSVGKESADLIGGENGDSGRTVQRYIRLTYLLPELLALVDEGKLKLEDAIELSRLTKDEQRERFALMATMKFVPKTRAAYRLDNAIVRSFFHTGCSKREIDRTIERALEAWFSNGGDIG